MKIYISFYVMVVIEADKLMISQCWLNHKASLSCYIRQRSWANVMYSSPFVCLSVCLFVCLSVCLFVCLLAGLLKKLWTDLNEI